MGRPKMCLFMLPSRSRMRNRTLRAQQERRLLMLQWLSLVGGVASESCVPIEVKQFDNAILAALRSALICLSVFARVYATFLFFLGVLKGTSFACCTGSIFKFVFCKDACIYHLFGIATENFVPALKRQGASNSDAV